MKRLWVNTLGNMHYEDNTWLVAVNVNKADKWELDMLWQSSLLLAVF